MNIILIGPQGSGKGTQAKFIAKEYALPHVSTGDMLRGIREEDSDLGRQVKELMDNGTLVPDKITNEVVRERLAKHDCKEGFILDGYPRNIGQARYLSGIRNIDYVIDVEISDQEAVKRLSSRLTCKGCGSVYNTITNPPKKESLCDKCDGELFQRDDDRPDAIMNRLEIYHKQTQPLIEFYKRQGILIEVNGERDISSVFKDIKHKIGEKE